MEDPDAIRRDILRRFDEIRVQLKRGGKKKLDVRQRMMLLAVLMDSVSSAPGGPREMMDKFHPGWENENIIHIPPETSAGWGVAYGRLANMVRQRMKDFTLSVDDLYKVGDSFEEGSDDRKVRISAAAVDEYVGKLRAYIAPFIGRMTDTLWILQIRLTTLAHIVDAADNETRDVRDRLVVMRYATFGWDSFLEEGRFEVDEEEETEEEGEAPPEGKKRKKMAAGTVVGTTEEQPVPRHVASDRMRTYETVKAAIVDNAGGGRLVLHTEKDAAVYVDKRIGSASAHAQVFKLGFRDLPGAGAALKMMIAYSAEDERGHQLEMERATAASQLVQRGESDYFALVYVYADCGSLVVPTVPRTSPYYNPIWPDLRQDAAAYAAKFESTMTGSLRGQVLVSELAWGDLAQYLKKEGIGDPQYAYLLIEEILIAIADMHLHLRFVHNDLTVENILVVLTDKGRPMPLVHDFGLAVPLDEFADEARARLEDARKILNSIWLRGRHSMPASTMRHIDALRGTFDQFLGDGVEGVLAWWRDNATPGPTVHELI